MKHAKHILPLVRSGTKQKLAGYSKHSRELSLNLHSRKQNHLSLKSGFYLKGLLIPCLSIMFTFISPFEKNVLFIAEAISSLFITCLLLKVLRETKAKRSVIYELKHIILTKYSFPLCKRQIQSNFCFLPLL